VRSSALRVCAIIAVSLLAGLPAGSAAARETCAGEQPDLGPASDLKLPPSSDRPTEVHVGLFVDDLLYIDEVDSSYEFRGVVTVSWCDPRLAFDPSDEDGSEKIYVEEEVDQLTESMWWPDTYAFNQLDAPEIMERALRISADGTVHHDLNATVRLSSRYDLKRFPFDRQRLPLVLESFTWSADDLVFVDDAATTGFAEDFDMPEWDLLGVSASADQVRVVRSTRPFSRLTLTIDIERRAGFYLWKVLLPLLVIVALSWSVFWMDDERFGTRVRMSATGILTVVAYQFVASQHLPRIGYLTIMDKITVISFLLLATTVLESYVVSRYAEHNQDRAMRIDRIARWAFPSGFLLMIAAVVLTSP
jgi:hypothetical protein